MKPIPEHGSIISIDPGANGAIAVKYPDGQVYTHKMPDTPADILDLLMALAPATAIIEKVGGYMPGNSGPASVKFARHCGHLDMALLASRIPSYAVAPGVWQKSLGALSKDKSERKRQIKDMMQRLYPSLKVTLINADALGMLSWATRHQGDHGEPF